MKKNMFKNKKNLVLLGIVVVLIIAIVLIVVFFKGDNKVKLEDRLKEIGTDFYENYYYDQTGSTIEEKEEFLSRFSEIGIKINLDNLSRYKSETNKDKIESFKNSKTGEACNRDNTRVIIYPKAGYGKTDYEVKTELDCGFEK